MDIKGLIESLTKMPFVLESLDKENQITFYSGNKMTLSRNNLNRMNFVFQNPTYVENTALFLFYGHENKSISFQITSEYESNKQIVKVVFNNDGKHEENYFVLKSLV